MKKSEVFYTTGDAYIQFEFVQGEDLIALASWDKAPISTAQWVKPSPGRYILKGTCIEDVMLIPAD
jgi:hypothetical protein